ncbi:MAG: hypothetical protein ACM3IJ_03950 [Candidatus Levyibacteriota bacterium]
MREQEDSFLEELFAQINEEFSARKDAPQSPHDQVPEAQHEPTLEEELMEASVVTRSEGAVRTLIRPVLDTGIASRMSQVFYEEAHKRFIARDPVQRQFLDIMGKRFSHVDPVDGLEFPVGTMEVEKINRAVIDHFTSGTPSLDEVIAFERFNGCVTDAAGQESRTYQVYKKHKPEIVRRSAA